MSNVLIAIFFAVSIFICYSPILFQNRRVKRFADEDLKKLDYDEWKKQEKSNIYIKIFSRIIWGLVMLSGFIFNFQKIVELGFSWATIFVLMIGIAFIIWGIIGFRSEIKSFQKLK